MPDETQRGVEEQIAEDLLRIHEESYGKGAERVEVLLSDDAVVVFMDGLELQKNEEFLIQQGEADSVIEVRGRYQRAIETTFRAAVERATGRRVVSFASVTKLEPHYIAEIFRLGDAEEMSLPEDPQ